MKKYKSGVITIYHDINHEARSMEILKCMELLCEKVFFVSFSKPKTFSTSAECIQTKSGFFKYYSFLKTALKTIKEIEPDLIFLHDNACSPILKRIVRKKVNCKVIYDSSELYVLDSITNTYDFLEKSEQKDSTKHGLQYYVNKLKKALRRNNIIDENKYLKYADVVIAANLERAKFMKEIHGLEKEPIVFNNIHKIDEDYDKKALDCKFSIYFEDNSRVILYLGGIAKERRTLELLDSVQKLSNKRKLLLLIAGSATNDMKKQFEQIMRDNSIKNTFYLGFITRGEIKYLLSRSDISVSVFSKDTLNNYFCESGKVYESLFEGVPVLTSDNPPLKRLCEEEGVGVSCDSFDEGIETILDNYELYKANIVKYIDSTDYEKRVPKLAKAIDETLNGER